MIRYYRAKVMREENRKGGIQMSGFNMKVTPQLEALTEICKEHGKIDTDLY